MIILMLSNILSISAEYFFLEFLAGFLSSVVILSFHLFKYPKISRAQSIWTISHSLKNSLTLYTIISVTPFETCEAAIRKLNVALLDSENILFLL